MYKVQNKSIEISNFKGKNRLLNNYLDWIIYSMLPKTIADVLFPKFAAFGIQNYAMEQAYVSITTQTILDTATTMTYETDVFSNTLTTDETLTTDGKVVTVSYPNVVLTNNDPFEGLGFGRAEYSSVPAPLVDDYLLAFIDVSATQLEYDDTKDYAITRIDEITTDEKIVSGDFSYLPGKLLGRLISIAMCYSDDGTDPVKEYLMSALTFAVAGVGNVSVTGFDDFFYETDVIYPKTTLYPSTTLYPTQPTAQIKSVRFTYDVYDVLGGDYRQCKTYIEIKDLDVSYNGTDMSINLVCERG